MEKQKQMARYEGIKMKELNDEIKQKFWDFCVENNLSPRNIQDLLDYAMDRRDNIPVRHSYLEG